jgi:MFS family permease
MLAGQMVSRFGHYKRWMLGGGVVLMTGLSLLATMPDNVTYYQVLLYVVLCGLGLGPSMPLYTLAVQNAIEPRLLGQATSASQFFRQIGGAIAAAGLGAVLTFSLAQSLPAAGAAAGSEVTVTEGPSLPSGLAQLSGLPKEVVRAAFTHAVSRIYLCTLLLVMAGWITTWFIPEIPLRKPNAVREPAVAE